MNRPQRQLAVLVPLLLVTTASELALNRLAVPELRLAAGEVGDTPPLWHKLLDYGALYLHYFASAIAIATLAALVAALLRDRERYGVASRYGLGGLAACLAALAAAAILVAPGETLTFWFESAFTALLACIVLSLCGRGGSLSAKLGVALVALPLGLHYYGPLASRTAAGREALWLGLPEQILALGQWGVITVALTAPYLFAPRPAARALLQPVAALVALFVVIAGSFVLHRSYELAMIVASRGFGLDIGPGAPTSTLALYVLALASVSWTAIACLGAPTPARRRIGAGLGLVVVAGYSFTWPLHYLASAVGLLVIADAARRVKDEEQSLRDALQFRAPVIPDDVWAAYVRAVERGLRNEPDEEIGAVTSRLGDGASETHIVCRRQGEPMRVRIERYRGAVAAIEVSGGDGDPSSAGAGEAADRDDGRGSSAPDRAGGDTPWLVQGRPETRLPRSLTGAPASAAPVVKTGDESFDRRFVVRDAAGYTDRFLDEGLRARAAATLDGWLAYEPGRGIRYRVHPGRGAPLDQPIPISELSFRGAEAPLSPERMVALVDFLAAVCGRARAR